MHPWHSAWCCEDGCSNSHPRLGPGGPLLGPCGYQAADYSVIVETVTQTDSILPAATSASTWSNCWRTPPKEKQEVWA